MSRCRSSVKEQPEPVDVVDLHGYRRDRAVNKITFFLSRIMGEYNLNDSDGKDNRPSGVWVKIITGSGSHSPNGPQLREAVRELLEKREMDFRMCRGNGAFLVRVGSGIELYENPSLTDTKITFLINDRPVSQSWQPSSPNQWDREKQRRRSVTWEDEVTPAEAATMDQTQGGSRELERNLMATDRHHLNEEEGRRKEDTEQEAHEFDQAMQDDVKLGSAGVRSFSEEEQLREAIKKSLVENKSQSKINAEEEERRQYLIALKESQEATEANKNQVDEDEALKKLMEHSLREYQFIESKEKQEEKEFELALALSNEDKSMSSEAYEEMVQRVMAESLDFQKQIQETEKEENRLLLEALNI
eukprot:CAMPEP_0113300890 /NCGR_PEP_ID=MMETSP0010_2-20120614/2331_1 /TAXON_ID=216773 ORGANISM="Corethron hystrix, Strain 308" /NCGR_SAMPLE_ID=MMETSP0010_2 /ASSEMBLY_ACC=CAM_ASM_000155 /LENGTH=359 /DNA_ID=CAMNT_0000154389 /DNA_START=96 /DNA_END=1175 /DNA_ORIENTATION=+ /assembly_acc=CAM_ASM_000155